MSLKAYWIKDQNIMNEAGANVIIWNGIPVKENAFKGKSSNKCICCQYNKMESYACEIIWNHEPEE